MLLSLCPSICFGFVLFLWESGAVHDIFIFPCVWKENVPVRQAQMPYFNKHCNKLVGIQFINIDFLLQEFIVFFFVVVVVSRVQLLTLWASSIHIYFYNYILAFIFVSYFLISTCLTLSWILFFFFLAFFWIDFFHSIYFPSTIYTLYFYAMIFYRETTIYQLKKFKAIKYC